MSDTDTIDLLGQSTVQETVFVLDRSSSRNLFGEQATAYGTSVNRTVPITPPPVGTSSSGAIRSGTTRRAATYLMERAGGAETATINGVKVAADDGHAPDHARRSYYTPELTKLGLPTQLTPEQLQAQFASSGVDANATATALSQALPPNDFLIVAGALTNPLPLKYYTALTGDARIEPTTASSCGHTASSASSSVPTRPAWHRCRRSSTPTPAIPSSRPSTTI